MIRFGGISIIGDCFNEYDGECGKFIGGWFGVVEYFFMDLVMISIVGCDNYCYVSYIDFINYGEFFSCIYGVFRLYWDGVWIDD